MRMRLIAASLVSASLFAAPSVAQEAEQPAAEPPAPADAPPEVSPEARAEAEKLLLEGRKQMSDPKQLDVGCETLTKSYALHQRGDVKIDPGEVHRRQGKGATA